MTEREDTAIEELDDFVAPVTWGDVKRKAMLIAIWLTLP
jgi:hypothetical protein